MAWFKKPAKPRYINGYRVREWKAPCPLCKAQPDEWCDYGCKALDLMDYR